MRTISKYLKAVIQCMAHPNEDWEEILLDHKAKLQHLGMQCPDTLESCRQCLKEHLTLLKTTERQERKSRPTRKAHQEELIKQYTNSDTPQSKEMAKILQRMVRTEATSAVFQQCAHARGLTKEGVRVRVLVRGSSS